MGTARVLGTLVLSLTLMGLLAATDVWAQKGGGRNKDRVARDFAHADANGDGKISRAEWMRRGNFDALDANGDGVLTLSEVREMYSGHDARGYAWPPQGGLGATGETDPSVASDRVEQAALDRDTLCGIGRSPKCDIVHQKNRGLFETGTGPVFPKGAACPGIDDYWAMDYANKRNRETYHGGIDVPVPWGTPMRAIADGSVVAKFDASLSKRGHEVVIRHSPEDTGLPVWTYSAYGHMDGPTHLNVGERVRMGQIVGPTGNSGVAARGDKGSAQSTTRRPAIHLATFFSTQRTYTEANDTVIPVDGHWLDPMAFYRGQAPFHSKNVIALPDAQKDVPVPVLYEDGTTEPADTKTIWPYTCSRN